MLNIAERDGVLVIELEHGKVNALDLELLRALIGAFATAPPEQPIVLTGAGRAFSAGVDLRRIIGGGQAYIADFLDALSASFLAVFDHPGPVVAAVNGAAIAGGCVLAAACDVRVISGGPIGLAELAVGVPFPTAAIEIMRGVLGPRTQDIVLGARLLTPDDALTLGLVDEVIGADALLSRAVERAHALAALPAGVFAHTKRQLQRPARERIGNAAADDLEMSRLWASDAIRAAIAGYLAQLARPRS
jgi:enoyl-CoA hydratase/carnithine racemase